MLVKLQHNHLHIYEEWQSFHKRFYQHFTSANQWDGYVDRNNDGLTERTNFVRVNLGKQGNTMLFIFH